MPDTAELGCLPRADVPGLREAAGQHSSLPQEPPSFSCVLFSFPLLAVSSYCCSLLSPCYESIRCLKVNITWIDEDRLCISSQDFNTIGRSVGKPDCQGSCSSTHTSLLFAFWEMPHFFFCFEEKQGEAVSLKNYPKKQTDLLCSFPIWDTWAQCASWSVLAPDVIHSWTCWEVTGKYKDNPGHSRLEEWLFFALCVCVYFLMAFLILCPWSKGKHGLGSAAGFHLAHMESRKRNISSKAPQCDTMSYIIAAFSFPKTLIPTVNTCSLSLRQIIPQSFGGLAELGDKLQLLLESTLGFYKPVYPEDT